MTRCQELVFIEWHRRFKEGREEVEDDHRSGSYPQAGYGTEWNGKWNVMERKFRYGIRKMTEWNGMEDFKNGMEDNFPYFNTNSILDFMIAFTEKHLRMSVSDK